MESEGLRDRYLHRAFENEAKPREDVVGCRDPKPNDPQPADEQVQHIEFNTLPGVRTAGHQASILTQAFEMIREERPGGRIENGIDAGTRGEIRDRFGWLDFSVDEHGVGTESSDGIYLLD